MDPELMQGESRFQAYVSGMPEVISSWEFTGAASSPASYSYRGYSPAQTTGYAIDQGDGYFVSSLNHHYPVSEVSPGGLSSAASSSALFDYHNSPAQTTGYAIGQGDGYFVGNSNYRQYPVGQERPQPASDLQKQEPYPSLNGIGVSPPPPLPDQPTHQDRTRNTTDDCPPPDPKRCLTCRARGVRQTDLERHLRTARVHSRPNGPACPVRSCKYTGNFIRSDNFKAHYKKQHGKSNEEADMFIAEWKEWKKAQGGT